MIAIQCPCNRNCETNFYPEYRQIWCTGYFCLVCGVNIETNVENLFMIDWCLTPTLAVFQLYSITQNVYLLEMQWSVNV